MKTEATQTWTKHSFRVLVAMIILIGMVGVLPAGRVSALGTTFYVKANASGANNGTSWEDAYTSLPTAISAAVSGDQIWVAAGTYHPGTNRSDTLQLINGVAIYGGFNGIETVLSERDPRSNVTVLSGNIGNPVSTGDNSYHVITSSNTDSSAVLDGFTITAGNAFGASQQWGGGLFNVNGNPTLTNLVISGNTASYGGGMFNFLNSNPVLTNVTFSGNSAERAGGMYNNDFSDPTLMNVTFSGNSAVTYGGAMTMSGSDAILINVTFNGNTAKYGGAMSIIYESSPTLKNVTISGNSASIHGGGIYDLQISSMNIVNSILYGNTGSQIYNDTSTPTISYSIVQGGYTGTGNLDVNPMLGTLQNNGGFTHTMALGSGSPAINAGDDGNCPAFDQRGIARPQIAHCDIGAYEYVPPTFTDVDITVGHETTSYTVASSPSSIINYVNKLDGPVKAISTDNLPIVTSQRVYYQNSFNELMGYPADQFTTEYWFPWYDQVWMSTWILVGNPSATETAYVDIYIGGVKRNDTAGAVPYAIPPGGRITPQFPAVLDGPVQVISVTGDGTPVPLPIFASERSIYASSFNEVMGYPADQFTTEYWYTWYDNENIDGWILVGNPSATETAYVDIYIGGVKQGQTYTIPENGRITPQFDVNAGPIQILSVSGPGTPAAIPIFTSERSLYGPSFNEMMGYPANQLASEYWFTWYDSVWMNTDIYVSKP